MKELAQDHPVGDWGPVTSLPSISCLQQKEAGQVQKGRGAPVPPARPSQGQASLEKLSLETPSQEAPQQTQATNLVNLFAREGQGPEKQ